MPSTLSSRWIQLKNRVEGAGGDAIELTHGMTMEMAITQLAMYLEMTFPMLALDLDTPLDELFARTEEPFPTLASTRPRKNV